MPAPDYRVEFEDRLGISKFENARGDNGSYLDHEVNQMYKAFRFGICLKEREIEEATAAGELAPIGLSGIPLDLRQKLSEIKSEMHALEIYNEIDLARRCKADRVLSLSKNENYRLTVGLDTAVLSVCSSQHDPIYTINMSLKCMDVCGVLDNGNVYLRKGEHSAEGTPEQLVIMNVLKLEAHLGRFGFTSYSLNPNWMFGLRTTLGS